MFTSPYSSIEVDCNNDQEVQAFVAEAWAEMARILIQTKNNITDEYLYEQFRQDLEQEYRDTLEIIMEERTVENFLLMDIALKELYSISSFGERHGNMW